MKAAGRRWWTLAVSLVTGFVVLAATLAALLSLTLQGTPRYRALVAARASQALGRPVTIGALRLGWHRLFRPVLQLDQVRAAGEVPLAIRRVRLGFALADLLAAQLKPDFIDVAGTSLVLEREAGGAWHLRGWPQPAGAAPGAKLGMDEISFEDVGLEVRAAELGPSLNVRILGAVLRPRENGFRVRAELVPPPQFATAMSINASIDGALQDPASWEGDAALELADLRGLPPVPGLLAPNTAVFFTDATARLTTHLQRGQLRSAHLDLEAGAAHARGRGIDTGPLRSIVLQLAAEHPGIGWRIELRRLAVTGARGTWPEAHGNVRLMPAPSGGFSGSGSVDFIRLDDVLPWFALWKGARAWPGWIRGVRGDLSTVEFTGAQPSAGMPHLALTAHARSLGWPADAERAGVQGLTGELVADEAHGRFSLSPGPLRLRWPGIFEEEVPVEAFGGTLSWSHEGEAWSASIPDLEWRALGTRGKGAVALDLPKPGASLTAHLALRAEVADAPRLMPYLPRSWGAAARDWLRHAIRSGRAENVTLVLDGPLRDYPFDRRPTGTWAVDLDARAVTLAFAPEWPALEQLDAHVALRGNGINATLEHGRIGSIALKEVRARLPDFDAGRLSVQASADAQIPEFIALVRRTPIAKRLGGSLERTQWQGAAGVVLNLQAAVSPTVDVGASGRVAFRDDLLRIAGLDLPVEHLSGHVAFDGKGLSSDDLSARLLDAAVSGRISPEPGHPDGVLHAQAPINFSAADGLAHHYLTREVLARLHGTGVVHARQPFSGKDDALVLSSDLVGVRSEFPEPLGKDADEAQAFEMRVEGGGATPLRLGIEVPPIMGAQLRFSGGGDAGRLRGVALRIGTGERPVADDDGVRIYGHAALLPLDGWPVALGPLAQAPAREGDHLPFLGADVRADEIDYGGFALHATHVRASPTADGVNLDVDGEGAAGQVEFHTGPRALKVRLDHLWLGVAANAASLARDSQAPLDPGAEPVLDVECGSAKMAALVLGRMSVHTSRVPEGQRLDTLAIAGGNMELKGAGTWRRAPGGSSAETGFSLATSDIAPLLQAFGYAQSVQAHRALFVGQLAWPKANEGLSLARAQGSVQIELHDGTLKSVSNPSAGRALGLLNLWALPRRFLLDFHDVVEQGLAFDKIAGHFKLGSGQATTDDLTVNSTSMKMAVKGRVGLAARDFDQQVTVTPVGVTTGVTVGATLLGGPAAGALALLAQELLGKPFDKLTQLQYHLTGSWDNPTIEKSSGS